MSVLWLAVAAFAIGTEAFVIAGSVAGYRGRFADLRLAGRRAVGHSLFSRLCYWLSGPGGLIQ